MPGPNQWRGKSLAHSLLANKLSEKTLNDRVCALLRMVKEAAKSKIPEGTPETVLNRPQDKELLRRAAAESIVMLKNDGKTLPLDLTKSVAVIGPNARVAAYRGGRIAHLRPYETVPPLDAIIAKSQAAVKFAQGVFNHKERPLLGHQLKTATGKPGFDMYVYSEPVSVADRKPVDHYEFLNSCGFFFNYEYPERVNGDHWHVVIEGDFTPVESGPYDFGLSVQGTASLYVNGECVVDNTTNQRFGEGFFRAGTVEEVGTIDAVAGKTYHVKVTWANAHTSELIRNSPLTFHPGGIRIGGCMQLDVDVSIKAAGQLAKEVDQVVVMGGSMGDWENEGSDKQNMDLPPNMDRLISTVLDANPNSVICISSGSPVAMPWVNKANNLLQVWYGGNETGNAIADVLYGDVNPCGKLPLTFPIHVKDTPTFLYDKAERRRVLYGEDVFAGYRYYDTLDRDVLFPFGHGLSYTEFALSDLNISLNGEKEQCLISVNLQISNVGSRDGSEVVQVYIQPESSSVNRPTKELKGWKKVRLQKGEKQAISVLLDLKYATAFWDEAEEQWCCEKGKYTVLVGTSSRGEFLRENIEIEKTFWWRGL